MFVILKPMVSILIEDTLVNIDNKQELERCSDEPGVPSYLP